MLPACFRNFVDNSADIEADVRQTSFEKLREVFENIRDGRFLMLKQAVDEPIVLWLIRTFPNFLSILLVFDVTMMFVSPQNQSLC